MKKIPLRSPAVIQALKLAGEMGNVSDEATRKRAKNILRAGIEDPTSFSDDYNQEPAYLHSARPGQSTAKEELTRRQNVARRFIYSLIYLRPLPTLSSVDVLPAPPSEPTGVAEKTSQDFVFFA